MPLTQGKSSNQKWVAIGRRIWFIAWGKYTAANGIVELNHLSDSFRLCHCCVLGQKGVRVRSALCKQASGANPVLLLVLHTAPTPSWYAAAMQLNKYSASLNQGSQKPRGAPDTLRNPTFNLQALTKELWVLKLLTESTTYISVPSGRF